MTLTKIVDYLLAAQFSCLVYSILTSGRLSWLLWLLFLLGVLNYLIVCPQLSPTVAEGDDTGFTPKDYNDLLYK